MRTYLRLRALRLVLHSSGTCRDLATLKIWNGEMRHTRATNMQSHGVRRSLCDGGELLELLSEADEGFPMRLRRKMP